MRTKASDQQVIENKRNHFKNNTRPHQRYWADNTTAIHLRRCVPRYQGLPVLFLKSKLSAEESVAEHSTGQQPPAGAAARHENENEARRRNLISSLESMDAPIDFFGVIKDQNGDPVADAEISFSTVRPGSFAPSTGLPTGDRGTTRSSAQGRFEIVGRKGMSLDIDSIKKPGYHEVSHTVRSFGYGGNAAPHHPDKASPVMFIAAKNGSNRALLGEAQLRFDWDGTPVRSEVVLGGSSLTFVLTPKKGIPNQGSRKYDWSLDVALEGGKVVLGKMGVAPMAPVDGYTENMVLKHNAADPLWWAAEDAVFYFRTKEGKYGQLKISVDSDRSKTSPTGRCAVAYNEDGGRLIERK